MIEEQSSFMDQPAVGNLNPKALVEKELEEARAVFQKHGILVPEGAPHSRTSSVILGLYPQKKRANKDKSVMGDGTKSVASKRSTTGKFEGGAKFGDYIFIKKGLTNGNQRW